MTNNKKKILAISGSTRSNSANEAILKFIGHVYDEVFEVEIYNGIVTLPHFNPDLDNENIPAVVKDFRSLIDKADGVIICTPEYVFSLPGTLKNAIEWTVSTTVFTEKPVAIIVASGLGEKAYESLLLIMNTIQAKIGEHAKLLIKGARSKLNHSGDIVDPHTLQALDQLVNSFKETLNK